jgi:GAF domain-containing protein/anti-sigma regulatory factor (Ser/Thr protein kinase)
MQRVRRMSRQQHRAPTALQSVLNSIARTAAKLCDARDTRINLLEGDHFRLAAYAGTVPLLSNRHTHTLDRRTPQGDAALRRRVLHIRDMQRAVRDRYTAFADIARASRMRTVLVAPLMHGRAVLGTILIRRDRVQPFTPKQVALLKAFADQAAIAVENARLSDELAERNRALTEALEQQTATSEILQIISSAPTRLTPVLSAIAERAARLCQAWNGTILLSEGNALRMEAHYGPITDQTGMTLPIDGASVSGRAFCDGRPIHVEDLSQDADFPLGRDIAIRFGVRTALAVPLIRQAVPIGVILIRRTKIHRFSDKQIALLRTFADQAVIAIENARLFTELQTRNLALTETLEQQTATSEILRVISRSPTDVQPVFHAIIANAVRLCGGVYGVAWRYEKGLIHVGAIQNFSAEDEAELRARFPRPLRDGGDIHATLQSGRMISTPDIDAATDLPPSFIANLRRRNARSGVIVPIQRDDEVVGAIGVSHRDVEAFSASRIELLKTFADQAVIAIENVRLFTELQARNRDLTTALEQQTATAEILRTISRSYTDVRPVFQAIVDSATRLLRGHSAVLSRIVDDRIDLAAYTHTDDAGDALLESFFPMPLQAGGSDVRPIRERVIGQQIPYNVADVETDPRVGERGRASARARGYRSQVVVPMLRDSEPIGTLAVTRREAGAFSDEEVALLQTFADQAVIAIENMRLFNELAERNRALTEALEQQTATAEILRVISHSPTDIQPVLSAVAESVATLCDSPDISIFRIDGDVMQLAVHRGPMGSVPPFGDERVSLERGTVVGRSVLERRTIHIADLSSETEQYPEGSARARRFGNRTVLSVPLLRDDVAIGAIAVRRTEVRLFTERQVTLLQTFADQAVIAIENVRLFNELRTRTEELTRSVQHLTALGDVGRALSSTLDVETVLTTIASRATQLTATDTCTVYEYEEAREEFHLRATHNVNERVVELIRIRPIRKGEGATGRVADTHAPVQVDDLAQDSGYHGRLRQALLEGGVRSVLAVPMLREARLIGVFIVTRKTPGRFADEVVALLQTFATQSAIAIHNARLYRELEAKSRELEAASHHKSQFLANMSHELRTPMNAIIGYTELIADGIYGAVPEPMRDVLTRVDASGRHLLGLINDVLDLSKIEAGQLTLALAEYSMKEVVEAVLATAEPLAAEKHLKLVVDVPPDLPTGRGDQRRLAQVLLNLVGNAIKFTDEGHIALRVGAVAGMFAMAVSDTGPGIPLEDQERIFEEFQQADTSRTRPKGGTGLGLAIARRIIAMHGGRIWVESTPGAGATFRITMPMRVEQPVVARGAQS